ncbi:MAG: hypothetical protein PHD72_01220 [Patescibacteria group bacterium]|nr:hypothetical protein [Patescibacteria group bacterium]
MVPELLKEGLAGWRVETWYMLQLSDNEMGNSWNIGGYFSDKDLATAEGRGRAWYGRDGNVVEVSVLTKDGKTGYVLNNTPVELSDQEAIRAEAVKKALSLLTPEQQRLLGLPVVEGPPVPADLAK